MNPAARVISIDKYEDTDQFKYRGKVVPIPEPLKQVCTEAKASDPIQFAATLTRCSGIDYPVECFPPTLSRMTKIIRLQGQRIANCS